MSMLTRLLVCTWNTKERVLSDSSEHVKYHRRRVLNDSSEHVKHHRRRVLNDSSEHTETSCYSPALCNQTWFWGEHVMLRCATTGTMMFCLGLCLKVPIVSSDTQNTWSIDLEAVRSDQHTAEHIKKRLCCFVKYPHSSTFPIDGLINESVVRVSHPPTWISPPGTFSNLCHHPGQVGCRLLNYLNLFFLCLWCTDVRENLSLLSVV